MACIGILGDPTEPHAAAVAREAEKLSAEVLFLRPHALERGTSMGLRDGRLVVDGVDLNRASAWWVKTLPPSMLHGPEAIPPHRLRPDLHEAEIQVRERLQLVLGWLCERADAGVRVLNPPMSSSFVVAKPLQLAGMRDAGVPVPKTLHTNDPTLAAAFRAEVGPCIVKPIGGGAFARDFDDHDVQQSLGLIAQAPIVVQERAFGEHVRVTLVGDELVSAVVIASEHLDYRTDERYHRDARYREANLSAEGVRIAHLAARASGLVYTGIDILRDGDRHVVLECNTSPLYLDVELRMGHPISARIAAWLVG
jgi:D-alanine-D-alanine ligase-like ATP-grasp enzyme